MPTQQSSVESSSNIKIPMCTPLDIIHMHFPLLESTNDWGKKNILTYDRSKITLITADEQTRGRGQYGRKWVAPPLLNIYASFCFFIEENHSDPLSLTHVMALSTITVLAGISKDIPFGIKWPNDIFVGQKKIAGILCETVHSSPHFGVIIGLGVNVNMPEVQLKEISQPATSLFAETGKKWPLDVALQAISQQFSKDLALFLKEGFHSFQPTFKQLLVSRA